MNNCLLIKTCSKRFLESTKEKHNYSEFAKGKENYRGKIEEKRNYRTKECFL